MRGAASWGGAAGRRGMKVQSLQGGVRFEVRVQPRASRTEVAGEYGEAVKIRLTAPPVEGAANDALVEFLSDRLGVSKSAVRIVRGHTARSKTVEVAGVRPREVGRVLLP